jgi:hypothetical protein
VRSALLLLAAPLLASCINTDPAVFVEATLADPVLTLGAGSVLVQSLSGSFTLELHLGARASGTSQVSLVEAKIQDATGTDTLLTLQVGEGAFPAVVMPDDTVSLPLTFQDDSVDPALVTKLCDPHGVTFAARIDDSLEDAPTNATSVLVNATGCP